MLVSPTLTTLLGVPFFNTTPFAIGVVEQGQSILGSHILGFQAGNEPDLYAQPPREHRPPVGVYLDLSTRGLVM